MVSCTVSSGESKLGLNRYPVSDLNQYWESDYLVCRLREAREPGSREGGRPKSLWDNEIKKFLHSRKVEVYCIGGGEGPDAWPRGRAGPTPPP